MNLIVMNPCVYHVTSHSLNSILEEFQETFSDSLCCFEGLPVSIKVDYSCTSKYLKARNVPFAIRVKVRKELENMVQKILFESVIYSD